MLQSAVAGLVAGGIFALIGVVVVIMFRTVQVLNFAQGAIGAFGLFTTLELHESGMAYGPATLVGLFTAAVLSGLLGAAMAWRFADASLETRSTVAIGYLVTLLAIGFRVFGDNPRDVPPLISGSGIEVGGVTVSTAAIVVVAAAVALAGLLEIILRGTLIGFRLRALAERPRTAELLGLPVKRISILIWAVAGATTALGIQIIAPTRPSDFLSLSLLIMPAFAAAAVGLFRSLSATVVAGLAIGVLEGLATHWDATATYQRAVPLLVLAVVLLWTQRNAVWDVAR